MAEAIRSSDVMPPGLRLMRELCAMEASGATPPSHWVPDLAALLDQAAAEGDRILMEYLVVLLGKCRDRRPEAAAVLLRALLLGPVGDGTAGDTVWPAPVADALGALFGLPQLLQRLRIAGGALPRSIAAVLEELFETPAALVRPVENPLIAAEAYASDFAALLDACVTAGEAFAAPAPPAAAVRFASATRIDALTRQLDERFRCSGRALCGAPLGTVGLFRDLLGEH